jgi:hypothetical protein
MNNQIVPAVINTAIQKQKIDINNVNLILPTQTLGSIIGEFDQVSMEVVTISSNPVDQEVFDLGKGQKCFSKVALLKIGNALGIQWDPNTTGIIERGENFCRARATGAIKKPNGEWISITEEKEIDLLAIEEEQRIKAEESAEKGMISEWKTSQSGKNYPVFEPFKSEAEKQKHIEMSVRKAVLPYRKFKAERAMTGAKERVIKALVAIKGTYTDNELSRPFAFPRIITDVSKMLNDPGLRQHAINKMTGSVSSIFGSSSPDTMRNVSEIKEDIIIDNPEDEIDFGEDEIQTPIDHEAEEMKHKILEWAHSGIFSEETNNKLFEEVNNPEVTKERLKKLVEGCQKAYDKKQSQG